MWRVVNVTMVLGDRFHIYRKFNTSQRATASLSTGFISSYAIHQALKTYTTSIEFQMGSSTHKVFEASYEKLETNFFAEDNGPLYLVAQPMFGLTLTYRLLVPLTVPPELTFPDPSESALEASSGATSALL